MNGSSHRPYGRTTLAAGVILFASAILSACGALFSGCAELKDEIPPPTSSALAVHEEGWTNPSSANFHGASISAADWDMRSCQSCHGPDYDGGTSQVSCQTCHSDAGGPENCATCHGSSGSNAPPEDLAGNSATSFPGVGAHAKHVLGGTLSSKVWCYECHTVPTSVYVSGHVDSDLPAEVPMNGALARNVSNGVNPVPVHDFGTLTCNNTYCHGNWRATKSTSPNQFAYMDTVMTGINGSPLWTGGPGEAACGTCHALPPTGHIPQVITACANCHSPVIDATGKISDRTLHINGKINVFGTERSF